MCVVMPGAVGFLNPACICSSLHLQDTQWVSRQYSVSVPIVCTVK